MVFSVRHGQSPAWQTPGIAGPINPPVGKRPRSPFGNGVPAPQPQQKMGWSDILSMIGGGLMDLDGTMGGGNMQAAQAKIEGARAQAEQKRLIDLAASGDQKALFMLDPALAMSSRPKPKDPLVVNNRVLDPNDPSRVLGDYSDPLVVNNQIVDPETYGVQADLRTPETPKYATTTTEEGVFGYNTADPTDRVRMGGAPDRKPLVQNTYNAPNNKGETKFQEGLGTNAANSYQAILEEGRAAGGSIGNLDTMETLLDGIDYTGLGGDALLRIQRLGAMFGADIPDLAPKEALKRLSSQMALSLKQDLPGPMSNADREFLLSIPPNLNVSPTGNDAILFILRKREERKQDMMRSLIEANPQSMEEYRMWENNYLQSAPPMFNATTQASLLAALSGASGEDIPQ